MPAMKSGFSVRMYRPCRSWPCPLHYGFAWAEKQHRRYVMLESTSIDVTVMERKEPNAAWLITTLTKDDTLHIPEVGIEIPVADLYEGLSFPEEEPSEA